MLRMAVWVWKGWSLKFGNDSVAIGIVYEAEVFLRRHLFSGDL